MSRIFISHSSRNNDQAIALSQWLTREDWDDWFLDLDPKRGIVAGERWEQALRQAADRCQVVLFLISLEWLASEWCEKELILAHSLNKQMFGVIIDPRVEIPMIPERLRSYWQAVDLAAGRDDRAEVVELANWETKHFVSFSQSGLARLKAGLAKAGLDAGYFPWPPNTEPDRAPYRGLEALDDVDAGIFFGRDAEITRAVAAVRGLQKAAPPRIFAIVGASGAGKSSLLRAGLMPRLRRDGQRFLVMPPIRVALGAIDGRAGLVSGLADLARKHGTDRAKVRKAVCQGGDAFAEFAGPLRAG